MARPRSVVALSLHLLRLRWAALGRFSRLMVATTAVLGTLALAGFGSCLLGLCPVSPNTEVVSLDRSPCPFSGKKPQFTSKPPCPHAR